jgi:NAD-dependent dihydropyrimidine dehydrogenase PreA subunit
MKPRVTDSKCGASESACTAIKACPVDAIRYTEVDEAIADRNVVCNTKPAASGCGCSCGCGAAITNDCGGNPYGRVVIDYDLCIECGICADECCGSAIEMVD